MDNQKFLDRWYSQTDSKVDSELSKIHLYYRNFWHPNYKRDETALKEIINNNVSVMDPGSKLNLVIYRNRKTSQMIMKNSLRTDSDPLKKHGVVYQILCPANGCNHSYIGMTTTRLSKRLAVHLQEGNFYQHFMQHHGGLQRPQLLQSTSIIDKDLD